MIAKDAVWLITGCSKGLGRALAEQALTSNYRVVVTARRRSDMDGIVEAHGDAALSVELDVTNPDQIKAAVSAAEDRFGRVDVLVNNAGYGYFAAIEEGVDAEVRAMFENDVFGPVNLVKAVLPGMRARRSGHIVNISSIGGSSLSRRWATITWRSLRLRECLTRYPRNWPRSASRPPS